MGYTSIKTVEVSSIEMTLDEAATAIKERISKCDRSALISILEVAFDMKVIPSKGDVDKVTMFYTDYSSLSYAVRQADEKKT